MGYFQHFKRASAALSVWTLVGSVAVAQDMSPVTPTTPETVPPAEPGMTPPTDETLPPVDQGTTTMYEATPPSTQMSPPSSDFVMANPEPMVDETTRLTFPNRPLLATGSALFAASYIPTIIYQGVKDRNQNLYIPVAGPWLDFARGDDGNYAKAILAVDGVLQGLGALGILASAVIPERRTRNWYLIGGRARAFNISPASLSRGGSYALMAQGSF